MRSGRSSPSVLPILLWILGRYIWWTRTRPCLWLGYIGSVGNLEWIRWGSWMVEMSTGRWRIAGRVVSWILFLWIDNGNCVHGQLFNYFTIWQKHSSIILGSYATMCKILLAMVYKALVCFSSMNWSTITNTLHEFFSLFKSSCKNNEFERGLFWNFKIWLVLRGVPRMFFLFLSRFPK